MKESVYETVKKETDRFSGEVDVAASICEAPSYGEDWPDLQTASSFIARFHAS